MKLRISVTDIIKIVNLPLLKHMKRQGMNFISHALLVIRKTNAVHIFF